jgi:hypothetical protein
VFAKIRNSAAVNTQYYSDSPSLAVFHLLHCSASCFSKDRVGGVDLGLESDGSPTLSSYRLSVPSVTNTLAAVTIDPISIVHLHLSTQSRYFNVASGLRERGEKKCVVGK